MLRARRWGAGLQNAIFQAQHKHGSHEPTVTVATVTLGSPNKAVMKEGLCAFSAASVGN